MSQAVSGGIWDAAGDAYPAVGWLGVGPSKCSGFLATPTTFVTAAHCVLANTTCGAPVGVYDFVNDPAWMSLSNVPSIPLNSADVLTLRHKLDRSGPIATRTLEPINACSSEDSALDVAIIQLDHRVRAIAPKVRSFRSDGV